MKRYEMVKSHEDFNNIINNGQKLKGKYFLLFAYPKNEKRCKFGIGVGKSLGNAVVRNKYKRIVRNIIDTNKFLFKNSYNYIIIIKKEALGVKYQELESSLKNLIRKDNL